MYMYSRMIVSTLVSELGCSKKWNKSPNNTCPRLWGRFITKWFMHVCIWWYGMPLSIKVTLPNLHFHSSFIAAQNWQRSLFILGTGFFSPSLIQHQCIGHPLVKCHLGCYSQLYLTNSHWDTEEAVSLCMLKATGSLAADEALLPLQQKLLLGIASRGFALTAWNFPVVETKCLFPTAVSSSLFYKEHSIMQDTCGGHLVHGTMTVITHGQQEVGRC